MTSFAFILGVLPLAFATGAGAGARNSVGTAVAGGMLASHVPVDHLHSGAVRDHSNDRARKDQNGVRQVRQVRQVRPMLKTSTRRTVLRPAALVHAARCHAQPSSARWKPVTLDEAVERALKNNPTIAQAAQGILRAEALLQQARAATLPQRQRAASPTSSSTAPSARSTTW